MRIHVCAVLAVAAVWGVCARSASAQPAPPAAFEAAPLGESLHGQARHAYEAGRLFYANEDYASAVSRFSQAYELDPDPRLLFDIAICEKGLHHYARTQSLLRRYVARTDARVTAESRAAAEKALAALAQLVGRVRVAVDEPGATVLVDGERAGRTPLDAIDIDLGPHTLRVEKAGFAAAEQEFTITGSGEIEVAISLKRVAPGARLVFSAEPEATISVDGRFVVQGRYDGGLAAGTHEVVVTAPGKVPHRVRLALREGETRIENVTLEEAGRPAVWPWVAGGGALAVAAGVGAYFLLRPPGGAGAQPPAVDHGYVQLRGVWGR